MASISTSEKDQANVVLDAKDAASRLSSIDPEATASPADTRTNVGDTKSALKFKLDDITNQRSSRRFFGCSPEKNRKDPFARFRLRQQQQQLLHEERLRAREHRRNQHGHQINDDSNQSKSQGNQRDVSNLPTRAPDTMENGRENTNGEETETNVGEKNASMPPPSNEMTKLVLLQRQNRIYRQAPLALEGGSFGQRKNSDQIARKTTEAASGTDENENSTLKALMSELNSAAQSCSPDGYHYTILSDGTPVYTSLPYLEKESVGADKNHMVGENEIAQRKLPTSQPKDAEGSLSTSERNQKGILCVNRSSRVPIAESSIVKKDEIGEDAVPTKEDSAESKGESAKDNVTQFKDIIGHQSVKLRLDEVLLPLALPESLSRKVLTGIRSLPASIFMYGPPGCGKVSNSASVE